MSRELDEACALAMGWKREERINEGPLWRDPNAKLSRYCSPPSLSVGNVYVTVLLDHLHKEWPWVSIDTYPTDEGGSGVTVQGKNDYGDKTPITEGSTLSEALAKLVVAVGDAKEKP